VQALPAGVTPPPRPARSSGGTSLVAAPVAAHSAAAAVAAGVAPPCGTLLEWRALRLASLLRPHATQAVLAPLRAQLSARLAGCADVGAAGRAHDDFLSALGAGLWATPGPLQQPVQRLLAACFGCVGGEAAAADVARRAAGVEAAAGELRRALAGLAARRAEGWEEAEALMRALDAC